MIWELPVDSFSAAPGRGIHDRSIQDCPAWGEPGDAGVQPGQPQGVEGGQGAAHLAGTPPGSAP